MWFENWSPFFDVEKTLNEMDRLLGAAGRPLGLRSVPRGTFPAINIYEKGDSTLLLAEIPGAKAEDLDVTVVGDAVTLKGRRSADAPGEEVRYYRRERPSGEFARTLTLPDAIDPDSVKAKYENGVLTVHMDKAQQAKPKKIQIHT